MSAVLPISGSLFFGYYVYKGYFWMIVTNGSVMINDIMAFVFGKTMGKTPLIKLSPNKTVEGFVGGGISTILFAIWVSILYHLNLNFRFFRLLGRFLIISRSLAQLMSSQSCHSCLCNVRDL
tara:strand:+ start:818 stop:1183 length:366 start_codon:yes stop_codon:yes gene_type:complete